MQELIPGQRVKVTSGPMENRGLEGVVLNPREAYGMFEGGSFPVKLDKRDETFIYYPKELIRIPERARYCV